MSPDHRVRQHPSRVATVFLRDRVLVPQTPSRHAARCMPVMAIELLSHSSKRPNNSLSAVIAPPRRVAECLSSSTLIPSLMLALELVFCTLSPSMAVEARRSEIHPLAAAPRTATPVPVQREIHRLRDTASVPHQNRMIRRPTTGSPQQTGFYK